MSAHPGASSAWLMERTCGVREAQPQALCISELRNFVLYFITRQLCVDGLDLFNKVVAKGACLLKVRPPIYAAVHAVMFSKEEAALCTRTI